MKNVRINSFVAWSEKYNTHPVKKIKAVAISTRILLGELCHWYFYLPLGCNFNPLWLYAFKIFWGFQTEQALSRKTLKPGSPCREPLDRSQRRSPVDPHKFSSRCQPAGLGIIDCHDIWGTRLLGLIRNSKTIKHVRQIATLIEQQTISHCWSAMGLVSSGGQCGWEARICMGHHDPSWCISTPLDHPLQC